MDTKLLDILELFDTIKYMFPDFYTTIYLVTAAECLLLVTLSILCLRKRTVISINMALVFLFGLTCMIGCVHGFLSTKPSHAKYYYLIYFSSMTLMLNSLYVFCINFSGIKTTIKSRILSFIITFADILVMLFITIFSKLIEIKPILLHNRIVSSLIFTHWYFNVHLSICYLYSVGTICLLIYKSCVSPKHNRAKYINILIIFTALVIANAAYVLSKYPFDITNYSYGMGAILVYFFSYNYKSRHYLLYTNQTILNDSSDIVIWFDESHKCIWFNKATKKFFCNIPDLYNYLEVEFEKWRNHNTQYEELEDDLSWRIHVAKDERIIELQMNLHKKHDDLDNYLGCYFSVTDITEQIEKEKEKNLQLGKDQLTGVPNRDYFFNQVQKIVKAKSNTQFLFICSNIIDFKIYNNVFGEDAGNKVLKTNANYIAQKDGVAAAYGRISGDMFAMLLDEKIYREEPFMQVMTDMEKEFSNAFYHLHMQMGVYKISNIQEPVSSMCEKAILAMKLSKGDINHFISWFKEDNLNKNLDEKLVIGKFEQSLHNGEFKLFLQPQVTKDNKVIGAEALARWIDIDGNVITPDRFIPVLENNGLVSKLDRFLWEEAGKTLEKWKNMGREDLHISVNISVKDFYHEDLYRVFTDLVEKYNINPKNLKLEITETAVINDTFAINKLLQKLRQFGFEIELDDFGSGYSSLGLLKDITVDALKLDMSFLHRSIETGEDKSWLILKEITKLAQILNMKTIVEGVEEKEPVDQLSDFGCDLFQGFYFARPETVTSFEERVHLF